MMLSIHVPKAAGNSFREALMASFGHRLLRDYGDWAGFNDPAANARRANRCEAMRARREELTENYEAIHGHFIADKYIGLFKCPMFLAFFRDPYQQTIAHYKYLSRNTVRASDANKEQHPEVALFAEHKPTIEEYIEWPMYHNHQAQFLGSLRVEELAFIGISEEYATSLDLFNRHFGRDLGHPLYANVNSERDGYFYPVEPSVRAGVRKYRAHDLEIYARAREIFERRSALVAA
jgi:hypothetical protein